MRKFSHKKIAGAVGILALVALLLVGTFAWYSGINQINEFAGTPPDKEIVLHDDFDPATGEKAAYVENAGKGAMFVRVRLDEYMDLTTNAPPAGGITDWTTHIPAADLTDCGFSNASLQAFHDYFTWHFGGQKYYLPGTPGVISQDTGDYTPDTGDAWRALTAEEQALVKQTPDAQVITMATYNGYGAAQKAGFVGWVYDTDGYAYWSQPLFSGNATGLLLNQVDTAAIIKDEIDYYYAVNVVVESVDFADLGMWLDGRASIADSTAFYEESTPSAKALLGVIREMKDPRIVTRVVTGLAIETPPDTVAYTVGELFDVTGLSIRVSFEGEPDEVITTGFSYTPANSLRLDHTEVTFKYGGQTVSVGITVTE